jgi:methylaspartate ammonia-lyase
MLSIRKKKTIRDITFPEDSSEFQDIRKNLRLVVVCMRILEDMQEVPVDGSAVHPYIGASDRDNRFGSLQWLQELELGIQEESLDNQAEALGNMDTWESP